MVNGEWLIGWNSVCSSLFDHRTTIIELSSFRHFLRLRSRMSLEHSRRREFTQLVADHILGHEDRYGRLPLCTPNVRPTICGVIVERRDHVRIAGGFGPPSLMRRSVFCKLRSMNGPFFNERGITYFSCPERSCLSFAYCAASYSHASAGPTASPDYVRLMSCPRRRHAGGRPGSSRRRELSGVCPSSVNVLLYQARHSRARCCRPGRRSPCRRQEPCGPRQTACGAVQNRLLSRRSEQNRPPNGPSGRPLPGRISML